MNVRNWMVVLATYRRSGQNGKYKEVIRIRGKLQLITFTNQIQIISYTLRNIIRNLQIRKLLPYVEIYSDFALKRQQKTVPTFYCLGKFCVIKKKNMLF